MPVNVNRRCKACLDSAHPLAHFHVDQATLRTDLEHRTLVRDIGQNVDDRDRTTDRNGGPSGSRAKIDVIAPFFVPVGALGCRRTGADVDRRK